MFLQKHMNREAVIGSVKRSDRWTFPTVAVREAIMNAIVHADYAQTGAPIRVALFDDRLEVENPGLLPFGLRLRISKEESRNCAIVCSAGYLRSWRSSNNGAAASNE